MTIPELGSLYPVDSVWGFKKDMVYFYSRLRRSPAAPSPAMMPTRGTGEDAASVGVGVVDVGSITVGSVVGVDVGVVASSNGNEDRSTLYATMNGDVWVEVTVN